MSQSIKSLLMLYLLCFIIVIVKPQTKEEFTDLDLSLDDEYELIKNQERIKQAQLNNERENKMNNGMNEDMEREFRRPHGHPGHHPGPHGYPGGPQGHPGNPGMSQSQQQYTDNSYATRFKLPEHIEKLLELIAFILFAIYILNLIIGKFQSMKKLENWNENTKEFFNNEYAHIGFGKVSSIDEMPFVKESNYSYLYYASGRKHVVSNTVYFSLKRRYNLFHRLSDSNDLVKYEILTDLSIPLIFSISEKQSVKQIKKSNPDINYFTETYNDMIENNSLVVLCEDLDSYKELFYSEQIFKSLYLNIHNSLIFLSVSDKKFPSSNETTVMCCFKLSSNKDETLMQLHFVHELINKLSLLRIKNSKELMKKRDEYDNKMRKNTPTESREAKAKYSKQQIKEQINHKKEEEKSKIKKLTPPTIGSKFN